MAKRLKYRRRVSERLTAALESGEIQPGRVYVVDVSHGDGCGFFNGDGCDCRPGLAVRGVDFSGGDGLADVGGV